ncbi:MAG: Lipoprotein [uncultured Clostridium sp.]
MNKKIICVIIMLGLLTGCSSNNNNNVNGNDNTNNEVVEVESVVEEPKVYTQFTALGKIYKSSKDINILNDGDLIYHDYGDIPYVEGEYKEVDFGLNLLTEYLAKNQGVYDFIVSEWDSTSDDVELISGEAKERIMENVQFLGEQFAVGTDDPIYFKIDKVILQEKLEDQVILEFRGYLSATNGNFRPLGTFTVTVYTKEDKLYGSIL